MSPIRLHKWVFSVLTRLYPGRYLRRQLPAVRAKRRPVTFDIDQLDRRESPTAVFAVDPVTARMVSFAALQEPLPPVVQVAQFSDSHASTRTDAAVSSPPVREAGSLTYAGRNSSVLGDDGATASPLSTHGYGDASSPLSTRFGGRGDGGEGRSGSWWRSEVYGNGAGASQAGDISLLSTLSGDRVKANLAA